MYIVHCMLPLCKKGKGKNRKYIFVKKKKQWKDKLKTTIYQFPVLGEEENRKERDTMKTSPNYFVS